MKTKAVTQPATANQAVDSQASQPKPPANRNAPRKPLQKARFGLGLVLSSSGMVVILMVAVGVLQDAGVQGRISLPVVAICVIAAVMLLGGGFGLMATAAPGFDDGEFDRLMRAGDPGNAPRRIEPQP